MSSMGFRSTAVKGLKTLKAPEEDGTEQDLEEFLTTLTDEVIITWTSGGDLGHVLEEHEEPGTGSLDGGRVSRQEEGKGVRSSPGQVPRSEGRSTSKRCRHVSVDHEQRVLDNEEQD